MLLGIAKPTPALLPLRELMAGNLCRCTGYDGIVDAVARAMADDAGPR